MCEADFDIPIVCFTSPAHRAEDCHNCDHLSFAMYGLRELRTLPELAPNKDTPAGQAEKCAGLMELLQQR